MTIRKTISQLVQQGHKVTYYIRKDGGVLIKSIDGIKFTGASGNIYARKLTGESLSTRRAAQLARITWSGKRAESYITNREIKKKLERVQRLWRKAFPKINGEIPSQGRKTARKVRWSIEHKGKEETMRLLEEAERYAKGKAYTKNIMHLYEYIKEAGVKYNSQELIDLAEDILASAWMIDEDAIVPTYQELYKLNNGVPPEEVARNVKRILQI